MKKILLCAGVMLLLAACIWKSPAAAIQAQRVATNQLQLTWQSSPTVSQELQHSTNLISWQELLRPYPVLVTNAIITNIVVPSAARDFFRLQLFTLTNSVVPTNAGMHTGLKLVSGGLTRSYRLFIPTGHSFTNVASPLAVILHGGGQTAATFSALHPDLFIVAETNGMILVLPDATLRDGTPNWANSILRPYETDIDDPQFILDLVNILKCALNVDNYRVYAGGFSSGGQLVHQLGEETTNVFAALASVGASIASSQNTNTPLVMPPQSLEPYPILIVNATNDCVRTYYGGVNIEGSLQASVAAAANYWVTNNGCTTNTVTYFVTTFATNYNRIGRFEADCYPPVASGNTRVTNSAVLAHFFGCGSNKVVDLISLTDGGHEWPNADDNVAFDANASVIAFFLQHARSTYVAPTWTGVEQVSVTSPIPNGGTFQAQFILQNPGAGLIPCCQLQWSNPAPANTLTFTSWNTPPGTTVKTNSNGDLILSFDQIAGHSSIVFNVSGVANVTINPGQESNNVVSSVKLLCDGGSYTTNVSITVLSQMDYGDAPAVYPTYYTNNGARHSLSTLRLGASIDVERDGFPTPNADGDDTNNVDDENGIVFLNTPQAGQILGLAVFSSGNGYVDAWVDYNRNGSWTNGNEQILASLPVVPGSNYVSVLVDSSAMTGVAEKTYWRFRLSSTGGLAPEGFAPNGEVEDYATTVMAGTGGGNTNAGRGQIDWGDAPAIYPVLAVDGGASHPINDGLCLGLGVDAETNGQPQFNALGDDNNGDDEDGVFFGALTRSTNVLVFSSAQVYVQGQGYLNAWIDFNGDGDWNDAGEQIVTSQRITFAGNPNQVTFHVPENAVLGTTFARFRFGVDAGLPPTGGANDGEVEDYKVTITGN